LIASLGLAAGAFASTNIDDIFVLVGFLSDATYRPWGVVLGQYLGIGVLVAASVVCALVAMAIPGQYIGLLGFAPIAIGLARLWAGWRGDNGKIGEPAAQTGKSKVLGVAVVTVANGADNLGIYVPMFATRTAPDLALTVAVFGAMTGLWCAAAHFLVRQPGLRGPIRRWGRRVLPFVLIGLGAYILWESGSLHLLA
jgi:cadmium resistance protein CadD (predicted permease)